MATADGGGPVAGGHDHEICVRRAIAEAESAAGEPGVNFTPVRRRALEILLESHAAMPAYRLLERLAAEGFGSQPPVVYRALDFLMDNGFAHRIERLNAFVACAWPREAHAPAFMICRRCRNVAETRAEPASGALERDAESIGFRVERAVVEAEGLCRDCAGSRAAC